MLVSFVKNNLFSSVQLFKKLTRDNIKLFNQIKNKKYLLDLFLRKRVEVVLNRTFTIL